MFNSDNQTTMNTLSDDFRTAIKNIEERAAALGENWTTLCKRARISRTTPDRWKKADPATIRAVSKVQRLLEELEAEAANERPAE